MVCGDDEVRAAQDKEASILSDQHTARVSPSTLEYRVSGPVVNLLLQKVTTQPSVQQIGDSSGQEHFF